MGLRGRESRTGRVKGGSAFHPSLWGRCYKEPWQGSGGAEACVTLVRLCFFPDVSLAILTRRLADRGCVKQSEGATLRRNERVDAGIRPHGNGSGGRSAENLRRDCPCGKAVARGSPHPSEPAGPASQAPPPET